MKLYCFTNRRRAKDTIMLLNDRYESDDLLVFVKEGLVYVNVPDNIPDLDTIMHYAELCSGSVENFLKLEDIEELYKGRGISKFRV